MQVNTKWYLSDGNYLCKSPTALGGLWYYKGDGKGAYALKGAYHGILKGHEWTIDKAHISYPYIYEGLPVPDKIEYVENPMLEAWLPYLFIAVGGALAIKFLL